MSKSGRKSRINKLKRIFTRPLYLTVLIAAIIVYYALFYYIITSSNYGIFLVSIPKEFIYALIFTSSVLVAISAYSIHARMKYIKAVSNSISGSVTLLAAGTIASCACQVPIFVSFLYLLGASAADVTIVTFYISSYQTYIIAALIAANLALIYNYLGRLP